MLEAPTAEFEWINIENLTEFRACRNSIQGALLIVDERGGEFKLILALLEKPVLALLRSHIKINNVVFVVPVVKLCVILGI